MQKKIRQKDVVVNTDIYRYSHVVSQPRGVGNWAFQIGNKEYWYRGVLYSTAKKHAIKDAVSLGETTILLLP